MLLGWAVIGCGDIAAKRVAPALAADDSSDLVAFFSHSPERAREMAERFGARRTYSDLGALLADDEVRAVYVASPPDRHCAETVAAARAGKHVLCEKPMALTPDECRIMIAACRENGVRLAIAYYRRWYPKARRMKELIEGGAIGRPLSARVFIGGHYDPGPVDRQRWRVTRAAGGGALMDVGSHRLDLICYFLGEPKRVAGATANLALHYEAPDTETLLCEMASGCHVTCAAQWNLAISPDEMEIHGAEGSLIATPFDSTALVLRKGREETPIEVSPPHPNLHFPCIASFAARVLAGQPPEFDGTDGMQASRLIAAAYRSAATGAWQEA